MRYVLRNAIARIFVSEKELVRRLPLFVKPGIDVNEFAAYIRWQAALNKIPFRQKFLKWRCKRKRKKEEQCVTY